MKQLIPCRNLDNLPTDKKLFILTTKTDNLTGIFTKSKEELADLLYWESDSALSPVKEIPIVDYQKTINQADFLYEII